MAVATREAEEEEEEAVVTNTAVRKMVRGLLSGVSGQGREKEGVLAALLSKKKKKEKSQKMRCKLCRFETTRVRIQLPTFRDGPSLRTATESIPI